MTPIENALKAIGEQVGKLYKDYKYSPQDASLWVDASKYGNGATGEKQCLINAAAILVRLISEMD